MTVPQYTLAATADAYPDKPAVIDGETGDVVTYAELEHRSRRIAGLLAAIGLRAGDHVALLMDNDKRYLEIVWAAQRSGLYFTPVNCHLSAAEARYIVEDCDAKVLFATASLRDLATSVPLSPTLRRRFSVGSPINGFEDLDAALATTPSTFEDVEGSFMLYSSGTTGRPKGILRPLSGERFGESTGLPPSMNEEFDGQNLVHLCSGPLYHAAPLTSSMLTHRLGGTVVQMRRFDPEQVLLLIEKYSVTRAQFVPTMFVRLLKLPPEVRARYDVSSLQFVLHTGAPCSIDVKEQMIDWWGEKIWEVYAGSEGNGGCMVDSATWLQHKGTVGRPNFGIVHIMSDEGRELPTGDVGTIYFSDAPSFAYHKDPDKTASSVDTRGWSTLGDLGFVDEDGFLYLSDRRTDLIISGGVNIYSQEVENVLAMHPKVLDVAVIGIPDAEMGQAVKAVVQPVDIADANQEFAEELISYCRERIAHFKCPRSVDFDPELPRLPNGKMMKRIILERYRSTAADASN